MIIKERSCSLEAKGYVSGQTLEDPLGRHSHCQTELPALNVNNPVHPDLPQTTLY